MKRFSAFTLAEVLITLAIIGVVAAISIPSVISNSQQQEFKTGLRKAVSVLNSAITMNIAIDGETPYDNQDLFNYLQRHMSVINPNSITTYVYKYFALNGEVYQGTNSVFYTTDGMRFEASHSSIPHQGPKLHESNYTVCPYSTYQLPGMTCGGCGSLGLANNPNATTKVPCLIMVDVNGDRKPHPKNALCNDYNSTCYKNNENIYKYPAPDSKTVTDFFAIMITEDRAVPFGVVAQRAMYQAQK